MYRGTPTDDNADCADLDKSNAQVINGQFLIIVDEYDMPIQEGYSKDFYDEIIFRMAHEPFRHRQFPAAKSPITTDNPM